MKSGADLGAPAQEAAGRLGNAALARAFTAGDADRSGVQADRDSGRTLIAHELAHVIQQAAGPKP